MAINYILDGESGLSVRTKLNEEIDVTNSIIGLAEYAIPMGLTEVFVESPISYNLGENKVTFTSNVDIDGNLDLKDNDIINIGAIDFDLDHVPAIESEGKTWWNTIDNTLNISTGLGPVLQVGQEIHIKVYNNTGLQIDNGTAVYPTGAFNNFPTIGKAQTNTHENIEVDYGMTTMDIPDGSYGFVTWFGKVRGIDTSAFNIGDQVYISSTIAGAITNVRPLFPNYTIQIGIVFIKDAINGEIFVTSRDSVNNTFDNSWDGAIRETFNFTTSSNGTIVTGSLENNDNTSDLTLLFSDGFYTLDTTPAVTITLIPGTDNNTQTNYIYIPILTKILTVSTSGFPTTEHCRVATIEVQSALNVQSVGGVRKNQNVNDHIKTEDNNGHILHMSEWIRRQFATWGNIGCEATFDDTAGNGYVSITSGKVSQLHIQDVPAISMPTRDIMIANDPDILFIETDNLNTITKFSNGDVWSNKWGKIVVWLIANKTGEPSFICVNIPRAGENSSEKALLDEKLRANYSIPTEYKSNAILIGAFSIKINAGVVTYAGDSQDLRGTIPSNIAGGSGTGGVTSFLGLADTPNDYLGQALKIPQVNVAETALEFTDSLKLAALEIIGTLEINSVEITDAGSGIIMSENERRRLDAVQGTGLLSGALIYANPPSLTISWSAGHGLVVDDTDPYNPIVSSVDIDAVVGYSPSTLGVDNSTVICIDYLGAIHDVLVTDMNSLNRKDYIMIGAFTHIGGQIVRILPAPIDVAYGVAGSFSDFITMVIGPANIDGNDYFGNADLTIGVLGGSGFIQGANFRNATKTPDVAVLSSEAVVTMYHSFNQADPVASIDFHGVSDTAINPDVWDDGSGILATVPQNNWTIQRIFRSRQGATYVAYGQVIFGNKGDAVDALGSEPFVEKSPLSLTFYRCSLVIQQGATDLSDITQAEFHNQGSFRLGGVSHSGNSITGITSPGGVHQSIQYNTSSVFDGNSTFIWDSGTLVLGRLAKSADVIFDILGDSSFEGDVYVEGDVHIQGNLEVEDAIIFPDGSTQEYGATPDDFKWHPVTARLNQSISTVPIDGAGVYGFTFRPNGKQIYFCAGIENEIEMWNLTVAWDISTAVWSYTLDLTGSVITPTGICFSDDGTRMFVGDSDTNKVHAFVLFTPWDLSTAAWAYDETFTKVTGGIFGNQFSPTGKDFFIADKNGDRIIHYHLTTPWDLQTKDNAISAAHDELDVSNEEPQVSGLFFKPDGRRIYIIGNGSNKVYTYYLETPWDLTNAELSADRTYDASHIGTGELMIELYINPDASKMYLLGSAISTLNEYDLGLTVSGNFKGQVHVWENSVYTDIRNGMMIEQEGTGNATLHFLLTNTQDYSMGIRGSDDNFILGIDNTLATSIIRIDTAGQLYINETPVRGGANYLDATVRMVAVDEPNAKLALREPQAEYYNTDVGHWIPTGLTIGNEGFRIGDVRMRALANGIYTENRSGHIANVVSLDLDENFLINGEGITVECGIALQPDIWQSETGTELSSDSDFLYYHTADHSSIIHSFDFIAGGNPPVEYVHFNVYLGNKNITQVTTTPLEDRIYQTWIPASVWGFDSTFTVDIESNLELVEGQAYTIYFTSSNDFNFIGSATDKPYIKVDETLIEKLSVPYYTQTTGSAWIPRIDTAFGGFGTYENHIANSSHMDDWVVAINPGNVTITEIPEDLFGGIVLVNQIVFTDTATVRLENIPGMEGSIITGDDYIVSVYIKHVTGLNQSIEVDLGDGTGNIQATTSEWVRYFFSITCGPSLSHLDLHYSSSVDSTFLFYGWQVNEDDGTGRYFPYTATVGENIHSAYGAWVHGDLWNVGYGHFGGGLSVGASISSAYENTNTDPFGTQIGTFTLTNSDETDGNYTSIVGGKVGVKMGVIAFVNDDHTNNYSSIHFGTRGSDGINDRMILDKDGDVTILDGNIIAKGTGTGLNNFIAGEGSGYALTTGENNVIIGDPTGISLTEGSNNILMGRNAGSDLTVGNFNTLLGYNTGYSAPGLAQTVGVGSFALMDADNAVRTTAIGGYAGQNAAAIDGVYLGYTAGTGNTTADKLFISNTNGTLIEGDFANNWVNIDYRLIVGRATTSYDTRLHVYENSSNTGVSAGIVIEQAGSSGDAMLTYLRTGTRQWQTGIDSSDDNKFKISRGFGTLDYFNIAGTNVGDTKEGDVEIAKRLGIGTTDMNTNLLSARFKVKSEGTSTNIFAIENSIGTDLLWIRESADSDGSIHMFDKTQTQTVTIQTDDADSYFNGGGNFGIGTNTPDRLLSVAGNAIIGQDVTTGISQLMIGEEAFNDKGMVIEYDHDNNKAYFRINGDAPPLGLTIADGGNFGLNTATPNYTLDVNGDTNITGDLYISGVINGNIVSGPEGDSGILQNFVGYSHYYTNGNNNDNSYYWTNSTSSNNIISTTVAAPDNTLTATRIDVAGQGGFTDGLVVLRWGDNDDELLANTEYTVSFWLRSESGDLNYGIDIQNASSGGAIDITLTSEWVRYDSTFTTDGTAGHWIDIHKHTAVGVVDIWGWQIVEGADVTLFVPSFSDPTIWATPVHGHSINGDLVVSNGYRHVFRVIPETDTILMQGAITIVGNVTSSGSGEVSVYSQNNFALGQDTLSALDSTGGANPIDYNTGVGNYVFNELVYGGHNVGIGHNVAKNVENADQNVIIGNQAGASLTPNSIAYGDCTFIGHEAGYENETSNNTAIGFQSGHMSTGSNCLFVGMFAGKTNTENDRLEIGNTDNVYPALLVGDMNEDDAWLRVNGKLSMLGDTTSDHMIIGSVAADDHGDVQQELWSNGDNSYATGDLGTWVVTGSPTFAATNKPYGTNSITVWTTDPYTLTSPNIDLHKWRLFSDNKVISDAESRTESRLALKGWIKTYNLDNTAAAFHIEIYDGTEWHRAYSTASNHGGGGYVSDWSQYVIDMTPYLTAGYPNSIKVRFTTAGEAGVTWYSVGPMYFHESDVPTRLGNMYLGLTTTEFGRTKYPITLDNRNIDTSPDATGIKLYNNSNLAYAVEEYEWDFGIERYLAFNIDRSRFVIKNAATGSNLAYDSEDAAFTVGYYGQIYTGGQNTYTESPGGTQRVDVQSFVGSGGLSLQAGQPSNLQPVVFELRDDTRIYHGTFGIDNTDTKGGPSSFFTIQKLEYEAGGAMLSAYMDTDGNSTGEAMRLNGFAGAAADTATSTSAWGVVTISAKQHTDGGSISSVADAGNIFTVKNHESTKFIVKGNGDLHVDGSTSLGGYDFAEYLEKESDVTQDNIIGLNLETGLVRDYQTGDILVGVQSSNPGVIGNAGFDEYEDKQGNHVIVGLIGQIENCQGIITEGRIAYTPDMVYRVGYILKNNRLLINIKEL